MKLNPPKGREAFLPPKSTICPEYTQRLEYANNRREEKYISQSRLLLLMHWTTTHAGAEKLHCSSSGHPIRPGVGRNPGSQSSPAARKHSPLFTTHFLSLLRHEEVVEALALNNSLTQSTSIYQGVLSSGEHVNKALRTLQASYISLHYRMVCNVLLILLFLLLPCNSCLLSFSPSS